MADCLDADETQTDLRVIQASRADLKSKVAIWISHVTHLRPSSLPSETQCFNAETQTRAGLAGINSLQENYTGKWNEQRKCPGTKRRGRKTLMFDGLMVSEADN